MLGIGTLLVGGRTVSLFVGPYCDKATSWFSTCFGGNRGGIGVLGMKGLQQVDGLFGKN